MRMRRTPSEAKEAALKAWADISAGAPVGETLLKYEINPATYQRYAKEERKAQRKKRKESTMTITEISPPRLGGKTMIIVTDDQETIKNIMEKFL